MCEVVKVSGMGKTWILDLDGTILKHNGYKLDGKDTLLEGAKAFLDKISAEDMVVFLTSRKKEYAEITEDFLRKWNIRFDTIIYNAPYGERILINDKKPSGLQTAIAVNTDRDIFTDVIFERDERL